ncbi:putative nucleic acid-binding protein [Helianthus annuus]|nr:putative nucleic acid-binding protein [Helianthus annuus]
MELGNITYLKDLDLARRDYTVKVRVLRLWKQPMYNNPDQFYSIEMIVVDEEGTTMQANVLRRWFPKFEHLLNESGNMFLPF